MTGFILRVCARRGGVLCCRGGKCDAVVIASRVRRLTRFEDVPPGDGIWGGV
ncbi:hypothetical protein ACVZJ5_000288 [Enterobacter hormaechei]|uniref:hypothetical protein n=1 Tax=Enterobacter hormaechei TaxID=158836 RepID=UPI0025AB46E5|nr:hypothetical protein [Enterobacter hormaechei]EKW7266920.1 hypothetical protein [Enterobacter hormaechei]